MNYFTYIRKNFENRLGNFRENEVLKTKSKIRAPSEFWLIRASVVLKLGKTGIFWKKLELLCYELLKTC